jgi:hypothetical protein
MIPLIRSYVGFWIIAIGIKILPDEELRMLIKTIKEARRG